MDGVPGPKARILVVDDSKLMRKAAHKMLGDEFDVVTADDGEEAWAKLAEDPSIQVVFTDLNMPNLDGYQLLQRMRVADDSHLSTLPIIVVTGADNDEAARMRALDMGATDFVTKPFTTVDLLARARAHVSNQLITQQLQAQATTDPLTGLGNLSGFLDRLQQDIAYARRHQALLSVVRLEVVDFRRLFLYHGRACADALLLQIARLLRARIRKEDSAGRVGLSGFALSLPAGNAAGIASLISRIRDDLVIQPPLDAEGLPITVVLATAVVGASLDESTTAKALLEQCELALAPPQAQAPDASAPLPVPAPAEPAPVPVAAPQAADPAQPALALRLDPLLDKMSEGDAQPLRDKIPQVIARLMPVFRLLGPNQRAQLIQFLQRLG